MLPNLSRGHDDSHLLIGQIGGKTFRRENPSEAYVCVPPALMITDSDGGTFTLGGEYVQRGWVFEFNVLRFRSAPPREGRPLPP